MLKKEALLAIDVGGSTTRAYIVDLDGNCLGHGRSAGGNAASNTPEFAARSIVTAFESALAAAGGPFNLLVAQFGLAGTRVHMADPRMLESFRTGGLSGEVLIAGDLLAMFASATPAVDGYGIVVGTGAGAIRVERGEIVQVADAAGWLLGDLGSGYWLGHEAAKAACAELDRRGPATALTRGVLDALKVSIPDNAVDSRPPALRALIDAIYGMRPIELAQFAPVVFANRTDPVAAGLIDQAERYVASDFATVFQPALTGPVVLGGGVVRQMTGLSAAIGATLRAAGHTPDIRFVADGAVGAAVIGLRAVGVDVDQAMFDRVSASMARQRAAGPTA